MARCGVWDAVTGDPVGAPLAGHDGQVNAVAVGRAGDRDVIVSGSDDGTVRVWDAVTGHPVGAPLAGHDGRVNAVAIGRAGDRDIDRLRLRRWHGAGLGRGDRRPGRHLLAGHDGWVNAVAVGRAGDRDVIVSGSDDGTVRVWDAVTGDPAGEPADRPRPAG